jgi:hypothetical protein
MSLRRWRVVLLVGLGALALPGCDGVRESSAPFAKAESLEAGGWPVLGSGRSGLTLRFIERGRFGIGIVLHNRSHQTVTVVDASTPEPPGSLVQQVGTRLLRWNPPPCKGRHSCPAFGFLRSPYTAVRPTPLSVVPGRGVGIQLNYRLGSCAAVPFAAAAGAQRLEIAFRYGRGPLRRESLPLGSSRLQLRMPTASDCVQRPHSQIAVDGPFATSSAWTIPGSSTVTCTRTAEGALRCSGGDTCTRQAGGELLFRSDVYQSPGKPAVRVTIKLPRFRGKGLYRTLPRAAPALGPAQVLVTVGIGIHGWTTFHASTGIVTVARVAGSTLGGRFHATLMAPRRAPFRAYGVWRCTTNGN